MAAQNDDPYDLKRFINGQADIYSQALAEIKSGRKRSHWMWFIFPQIDGLGFSAISKYYAVKSLAEALAYLRHPVLGNRLIECTQSLLAIQGRDVAEIFGYPDDLKLRSCMTLFAQVSEPGSLFDAVLARYFDGKPDEQTLKILNKLN